MKSPYIMYKSGRMRKNNKMKVKIISDLSLYKTGASWDF